MTSMDSPVAALVLKRTELTTRSTKSASVTVSGALPDVKPAALAVMVSDWLPSFVPSVRLVIGKVMLVAPCGITTETGTVASLVLLLAS